jgi:hypothetical protein
MLKKAQEALKKATDSPAGGPVVVEGQQGPAAPLKTENSPWSLQMEIVGGQTVLTAQLHKTREFRITCDRVEMKTPNGSVLAIGKVSFAGPGIKGVCNKLTLPLSEDRLLLEGDAEVQIEQRGGAEAKGEFFRNSATAAELKADHLTLRLPAPASSTSAAPMTPSVETIGPSSSGPSILPGGIPGTSSPLLPTPPTRPAP